MSTSVLQLQRAVLTLLVSLPLLVASPTLANATSERPDIGPNSNSSSVTASALSTRTQTQPLTDTEIANAIPMEDSLAIEATTEQTATTAAHQDTAPRTPVDGSNPVAPDVADGVQVRAFFNNQIGKIIVRTPSGSTFSCSGSAVNSDGKNMVLTAGHCVYGRDANQGWYNQNGYRWFFIPGYSNGNKPVGQWEANSLATKDAWINNGSYDYDVAVARVNPLNGRSLVSTVGGLGLQWDYPKDRDVTAQGYPAENPFNGQGQFYCTARSKGVGSNQIQIPCNMTRGSSGGPWLAGYSVSDGYANGVVSTVDRIVSPTVSNSPYFSSGSIGSLFQAFRNW